ncbi:Adenosylcobinamide amidohydrolase [Streptoalloteichus tenebrarius]|uniref:Adenosylcobinamide amidohydrolase n=1 Tax=Streptoalloteichus tenebrarius (strain ATCC 17920 / DSM 40477 / JCM 4838 / CBS 697.72 / NBRC 16177 / NCIMB 11028 / NRRL B-12390 / A12253. 1 / ISP 5477) TaxID=1933 RepID=A0ABT1HYJ5_STRSD|nr:adenosylcobinamide amidohydrolase [Streptoalloteichus tenebrarius]MCP2260435.1 Adenosylcobinamide amidohydrolase [Streptoalloteichus tenebrarius]BFF02770.1 adenosylcobinamide amidohydrolase [Streptoalloteichus tenebrarius]
MSAARATPPEPRLAWVAGRPLLVWRCDPPWLAISSGPHGGGLGPRHWVVNATVWRDYDRDDPDVHVAELAEELGLDGRGTGLLTAVDVRHAVSVADGGVRADVTTGVGYPVWAAAPPVEPPDRLVAGTINAVCWLPVRLSDAALVNAVATVAEAKAQALFDAGVPGTGTCTDAVVLLCPATGPAESYGGPRSRVGSALARAVHQAVSAGLRVPHPRFRE